MDEAPLQTPRIPAEDYAIVPTGLPNKRGEEDEEEEWEGIDDRSVDTYHTLPSASTKPKATETEITTKNISASDSGFFLKDALQTSISGNAFEVLEDAIDDEGDGKFVHFRFTI